MLINVKMPTIVGILTFMSMINFILRWVEHEKDYVIMSFPVLLYANNKGTEQLAHPCCESDQHHCNLRFWKKNAKSTFLSFWQAARCGSCLVANPFFLRQRRENFTAVAWRQNEVSSASTWIQRHLVVFTVLPAKSDSYVMFCLQCYQGLWIDRSLEL